MTIVVSPLSFLRTSLSMKIIVPEFSLIALIGVTGSGKSSFGRRHFLPTEVVSSDFCRGLVADDENAQGASGDAFDILYTIVGKRLKNYKLTVIDATSVQAEDRKRVVEIAREYHTFPVAIVLDMPESVCRDRNAQRSDRQFGPHVITRQRSMLKRSLRNLEREGFRRVYVLNSEEDVNRVELIRERMWTDKTDETGPFDIIGDVHGCFDELIALLTQLGYAIEGMTVTPPAGRKAVFVGDLVDRGPKIPQVLKLVMGMVEAGTAICVPGNHDMKLLRALRGKNVQVTHGLADSLTQLAAETGEFRQEVIKFLNSLVSHYVLDGGKLVVAHAGMKESMMGRAAGAVRDFALYGETTGESDEFGLPVRLNWAADYRGRAMVVYGHTPVPQPEWLNNTMNIDTGCVFGGALTALRYPEQELVSVPALQTYVEPIRPFLVETIPPFSAQQEHDDVLDIADVVGKRLIDTRLQPKITIREANATAALEVMSRYAVNPKWLVYLPPTMSPVETSDLPDLLEHPS
jgi:protein phosphatase